MSDLLARTEKFFFQAMQGNSWPNGNDGTSIPGWIGWNCIAFAHSDFPGFLLTDEWGIGENGKPAGVTSITCYGRLVWVMWYGEDSYDKQAIPFLRKVLMIAYDAGQFYGGRGPKKCTRDGFDYCNDFKGDFTTFEGFEYVIDRRGSRPVHLGGHAYGGRFLG